MVGPHTPGHSICISNFNQEIAGTRFDSCIILAVALTMRGTTPDLSWTVKPHDPSIYIGVLLLMLLCARPPGIHGRSKRYLTKLIAANYADCTD